MSNHEQQPQREQGEQSASQESMKRTEPSGHASTPPASATTTPVGCTERWLDADQEPEALLAGISQMLAASPEPGAEEWAIHDHEGFCDVRLSEYISVEAVSKIAQGIVEHGRAYGAWASYLGPSGYDNLDRFEDCYQGRFESLTDYAEDFLDALGLPEIIERHVPEELQPYVKIDAEGFGRDMSYNGEIYGIEDDPAGGVFIFGP